MAVQILSLIVMSVLMIPIVLLPLPQLVLNPVLVLVFQAVPGLSVAGTRFVGQSGVDFAALGKFARAGSASLGVPATCVNGVGYGVITVVLIFFMILTVLVLMNVNRMMIASLVTVVPGQTKPAEGELVMMTRCIKPEAVIPQVVIARQGALMTPVVPGKIKTAGDGHVVRRKDTKPEIVPMTVWRKNAV
jgi:hypothetical protein